MGDVSHIVGGGTPRTADKANFQGGEIPWITPADLSGYAEKYISHGKRNITQKGLVSSSARLMPKGTVLLSSRAPIGYVAIASNSVCTNQGFKSFVLPDSLDSEYVYYYLMRARSIAIELASGTTFLEISGKRAAKIPLPMAPLPQQHRIVAAIESYLTRLDAAVASLERVQKSLKRYRASVLKAAVEGRLVPTEAELARKEGRSYESACELLEPILAERKKRWIEANAEKARGKAEAKALKAGKPWTHADDVKILEKERDKAAKKYKEPSAPDTSNLPDLPEGWCWTSSDQLMRYVTSGSRDWSKYYSDGGALFVRTEDIKWNYLDLSSVAHVSLPETVEGKRSLLQPRDLLITITGANVGRCAVVPQQISEAYVSQSIALVRLVDSSLASYLHLFSQTNLQGAQTELERLAYGMGRPVLNLTNVRELNIPLPPLGELQRIVEEADSRLCQGESIRELVRGSGLRIDRLRQSILKWAFEGKLIPQDSEDEPASALLDRIKAECSASRRYR